MAQTAHKAFSRTLPLGNLSMEISFKCSSSKWESDLSTDAVQDLAGSSQTEGHGHCQRRVTIWVQWDCGVNLDRQSKMSGLDLFLKLFCSAASHQSKYKRDGCRENPRRVRWWAIMVRSYLKVRTEQCIRRWTATAYYLWILHPVPFKNTHTSRGISSSGAEVLLCRRLTVRQHPVRG